MNLQSMSLVMIPQEELANIKSTQEEILQQLKVIQSKHSDSSIAVKNITAKEFMAAVRICRSKFDQLVNSNQIKTIKKRRKIYVPASEIDRYFIDPSIQ
jgi:hypothetical protein